MLVVIQGVLGAPELAQIGGILERSPFEPGECTGGSRLSNAMFHGATYRNLLREWVRA